MRKEEGRRYRARSSREPRTRSLDSDLVFPSASDARPEAAATDDDAHASGSDSLLPLRDAPHDTCRKTQAYSENSSSRTLGVSSRDCVPARRVDLGFVIAALVGLPSCIALVGRSPASPPASIPHPRESAFHRLFFWSRIMQSPSSAQRSSVIPGLRPASPSRSLTHRSVLPCRSQS